MKQKKQRELLAKMSTVVDKLQRVILVLVLSESHRLSATKCQIFIKFLRFVMINHTQK